MSQIPLRAVASPVDIYAPDAVQLGLQGTGVANLARSLGSLSSTLARFAKYQNEEDKRTGLEEAQELQRQHRFANIMAYHSKVESGEIEEGQNPWKLVFLRQLVAREQVAAAALTVEQDLFNNPPEDLDDLPGIRADVQSRLQAQLGDLDSFEFQAVAGVVDDFTDRFTTRYQRRREEERVLEADEALTRGIRSFVDGSSESISRLSDALVGPPTPEAAEALETFLQGFQGTVDAAVAVTPAPRVRQRILAVIEEAALAHENIDLARGLLSRVTVDGQSMADQVDSTWYSDLETSIERRQISGMQLDRTRDNLMRAEQVDVLSQMMFEAHKSGQPFVLPDNLPFAVQQDLQQLNQTLNRRAVDGLLSEASAAVLSGEASAADIATYQEAMVALGKPGIEGVMALERVRALRNEPVWASTTTPRMRGEVLRLQRDTSTSWQERHDALVTLAESGQISLADFNSVENAILQTAGTGGTLVSSMVSTARSELESLVAPNIPMTLDPIRGMVLDPNRQRDLDVAMNQIQVDIYAFVEENPDAGRTEIREKIDELLDAASPRIGGMTRAEKEANREREILMEEFKLVETLGYMDPFQMPSSMRFKDGEFILTNGTKELEWKKGTPMFIPPGRTDLFSNHGYLSEIYRKLHIDPTDPKQTLEFMKRQKEHYPNDDRLTELIKKLQRAVNSAPRRGE